MAKLKLEVDYDYNFLLFGICSHVKDYRLCHYINNALGISLVRQDDIKVPVGRAKELTDFSRYEWSNRTKEVRYLVIANRGENGFLIKERNKVDYFLLVEGQYLIIKKEELLEKIKQIQVVLTVFEMEPETLPSAQNLFFE